MRVGPDENKVLRYISWTKGLAENWQRRLQRKYDHQIEIRRGLVSQGVLLVVVGQESQSNGVRALDFRTKHIAIKYAGLLESIQTRQGESGLLYEGLYIEIRGRNGTLVQVYHMVPRTSNLLKPKSCPMKKFTH